MQFRTSYIHILEGWLHSALNHINSHTTNANDQFYLFFFALVLHFRPLIYSNININIIAILRS